MGAQWKAKGSEAAANARGRLFTKLAKEIMIAARNGGDPGMNSKLHMVVEQAKKSSMPKDARNNAWYSQTGIRQIDLLRPVVILPSRLLISISNVLKVMMGSNYPMNIYFGGRRATRSSSSSGWLRWCRARAYI